MEGGDDSQLAKRVDFFLNWDDFLTKFMMLCQTDEYDPEKSPYGYINLGTAVNNMCNDLIHPQISCSKIWNCDTSQLQYLDARGTIRLRKALATLMTEFFKTFEPVNPENLFCNVGATGCMDILAHCIADPGDIVMTPTPCYGRVYTNFMQRSLVEIWPIPIIKEDSSDDLELTIEKIQQAYNSARQQGRNVRAIMLLNPSNPLGDVYSPELLMSILQFCREFRLHCIVDEIFALSVFDKNTEFYSILRLKDIPDPCHVHVIYGLSKDFAMAGLRAGVIHTKNKHLQKCLTQLAMFQTIPYPMMQVTALFLEDMDFCRHFDSVNKSRLQEKYNYAKQRLEKMGLRVRLGKSAFFLWTCFREKCEILTFDEETRFFNYLVNSYHLYFVPGKELYCQQPGWFRITFTGDPDHVVTGLNRLESAIEQWGTSKDSSNSMKDLPLFKETEGSTENLENLMGLLRNQILESNWLSQQSSNK